jgi:transposase
MHKASGQFGVFFYEGSVKMNYLGIDVAKAKLDCSLLLEPNTGKRKIKTVSNHKQGVTELIRWLEKQGILPTNVHAIMEGTGVYHEQAAMALHDAGVTVSIINPAQIRDFAKGVGIRTKTDGVDSGVLARYGALLQPSAWVPPKPQARALQALLSRREAIAQDLQRERNRQEKADATQTPELIHKSLLDSITFLQGQLTKLQRDIDEHIDRHPELKDDLALLKSIPAVGPQTGSQLLSVMHCHCFSRAEQLAAYLGLVPVERQSGSSVLGKARLSKTGPAHLRAVLYIIGFHTTPSS